MLKRFCVIFVLSASMIGIFCSANSEEKKLTQLPREISGLELGQKFDTKAECVHVFGDPDGSEAYVYNDAKNNRPINVDIDDQGLITRLSWHFLLHDSQEEARKDLQEKFGKFFKRKEKTDDGEKLVFEDVQTFYTVTFEGHMITIVTCDLSSGNCGSP